MEVTILTKKKAEKIIRDEVRAEVYAPVTTITWLDPYEDKSVSKECWYLFGVAMPFQVDVKFSGVHEVAIGVIGCELRPTNPDSLMWSRLEAEIISGEIYVRWLKGFLAPKK
jgi:hypothetical protein